MLVYLIFYRFHNFWMPVAKVAYADSGDKVNVSLAVWAIQVNALSALDGNEVR
jgi:hypothetical protein